jgi:hypothetical protein
MKMITRSAALLVLVLGVLVSFPVLAQDSPHWVRGKEYPVHHRATSDGSTVYYVIDEDGSAVTIPFQTGSTYVSATGDSPAPVSRVAALPPSSPSPPADSKEPGAAGEEGSQQAKPDADEPWQQRVFYFELGLGGAENTANSKLGLAANMDLGIKSSFVKLDFGLQGFGVGGGGYGTLYPIALSLLLSSPGDVFYLGAEYGWVNYYDTSYDSSWSHMAGGRVGWAWGKGDGYWVLEANILRDTSVDFQVFTFCIIWGPGA